LGSISSTRGGVSWSSKTRPRPSAEGLDWGHVGHQPEGHAMLLVCQSIWPHRRGGKTGRSATRSPTAIRNFRPFRLRRKQIRETSRSGTWTTRHTRSRFLFDLPFPMGEGLCGHQGERTTLVR
jgi:hypothetical protein